MRLLSDQIISFVCLVIHQPMKHTTIEAIDTHWWYPTMLILYESWRYCSEHFFIETNAFKSAFCMYVALRLVNNVYIRVMHTYMYTIILQFSKPNPCLLHGGLYNLFYLS